MVTLGEFIRWLVYTADRAYRRAAAWLLRRDRLVTGSERKFRAPRMCQSGPGYDIKKVALIDLE